jgi:hypothetical protein
MHATCESLRDSKQASKQARHASTQANKQAVCVSCGSGWSVLCVSIQLTLSLFRKRSVCSSCPPRAGHGGQVVVVNSCSGARGSQLYELPAWGPIDVVWLGRTAGTGVGAGSLKILSRGVLVHRATRPQRQSVFRAVVAGRYLVRARGACVSIPPTGTCGMCVVGGFGWL